MKSKAISAIGMAFLLRLLIQRVAPETVWLRQVNASFGQRVPKQKHARDEGKDRLQAEIDKFGTENNNTQEHCERLTHNWVEPT